MKGKMKRIIAMVCVAIMVVSSITVHKQSVIKAGEVAAPEYVNEIDGYPFCFTWEAVTGITKYNIYIYNGDINSIPEPIAQVESSQTTYNASEKVLKLASGKYTFGVTVIDDNGAESEKTTTQFEVIKHSINYYETNGEEIDIEGATEYIEGIGIILPTKEKVKKDGYIFEGWYSDVNLSGNVITNIESKEGEDKNFYAKWTADKAIIQFRESDGTTPISGVDDMKGVTDEKITESKLPEPTKKGYTFEGWYSDEKLEKKVEELPEKYPAGKTIYYAKWKANEAIIQFRESDGTTPISGVDDMKGVTDEEITESKLPEPTKKGYTFEGWYSDKELKNKVKTLPEKYPVGKTTYYATWKLNDIHSLSISKPDNKTAEITWKMTNPDSDQTYEVYLDGKLVKSSLRECKYTISNIKTGSHQIKVVAVHNLEKIVKSTGLTKSFNVTTTLTVKKSGKVFKYLLGLKSSYALPVTHSDFIKKYPELNNSGYVFSGWYKGTKKVTSIKEDTELMTKWRMLKTRFKNVKVSKGKVKLTFNSTDWKNVDGIKITYSRTKNFKNKKSVIVKTNKKTMKSYTFKNANKKFKNGAVYFFKVQFYYNNGSKKVIYKGSNVSKWIRYYKK